VTQPAVALRDVTCTFQPRTRHDTPYTAVRDVSVSIADGEFVSVVGPTGCGKSTILNMIAGLLTPACGTVSIFGDPLSGLNRQAG
jgi:NitT/TauT family transport system ATP-binding protein